MPNSIRLWISVCAEWVTSHVSSLMPESTEGAILSSSFFHSLPFSALTGSSGWGQLAKCSRHTCIWPLKLSESLLVLRLSLPLNPVSYVVIHTLGCLGALWVWGSKFKLGAKGRKPISCPGLNICSLSSFTKHKADIMRPASFLSSFLNCIWGWRERLVTNWLFHILIDMTWVRSLPFPDSTWLYLWHLVC